MNNNQVAELFAVLAAVLAQLAFVGIIAGIFLLGSLIVTAVVCFLLTKMNDRLPEPYRRISNGQIWLLLIPCFSLVWNFFVFPVMADGIREAQAARGEPAGDGGRGLALAYCIVTCCTMIPCVNYLATPAALVLLIITMVKFHEYTDRLRANFPPPAP